MTQATDTRELEKELLAGLEGVTPGPWVAMEAIDYPHKPPPEYWFVSDGRGNLADDVDRVDAEHFARCSPDNIRALLTTIADLRATVAEAVRVMEPFATMADTWAEEQRDSTLMDWHEEDGVHINLGHCRAARAFTAKHGGSNASE